MLLTSLVVVTYAVLTQRTSPPLRSDKLKARYLERETYDCSKEHFEWLSEEQGSEFKSKLAFKVGVTYWKEHIEAIKAVRAKMDSERGACEVFRGGADTRDDSYGVDAEPRAAAD